MIYLLFVRRTIFCLDLLQLEPQLTNFHFIGFSDYPTNRLCSAPHCVPALSIEIGSFSIWVVVLLTWSEYYIGGHLNLGHGDTQWIGQAVGVECLAVNLHVSKRCLCGWHNHVRLASSYLIIFPLHFCMPQWSCHYLLSCGPRRCHRVYWLFFMHFPLCYLYFSISILYSLFYVLLIGLH